jgi:hypothetical protein
MAVVGLALSLSASTQAIAKDLGEILLDKGVITKEELEKARQEEKQKAAAETSMREAVAAKIPLWLSQVTLFGDLRLRHEGFYEDDLHARNRFRMRGRIGLTANVTDEVSATFRLATGNPDDPISTNQSFEKTFSRKSINFDQGYVTLKPSKTFHIDPGWFTLHAGKMPINVFRVSELVFDDDLTPEGATEVLTFWDQKSGFLRNSRIIGFQWAIDELAADGDPWMAGAQVVADMAPTSSTTWSLALGDYNFMNINKVATKFLNQFTDPPLNTVRNTNFNSALANSNSLDRDANGLITGYSNSFNILTGLTEFNSANAFNLGIPAGVFGEFAWNTAADNNNFGFALGAGIGKAGKDWYHNTLKNPGDWGMAYTYEHVAQDAVLSLFSASDLDYTDTGGTQKGATNMQAHILRIDYELFANFQLTAKAEFIEALHANQSNAPVLGGETLVRTQLDAVLKF